MVKSRAQQQSLQYFEEGREDATNQQREEGFKKVEEWKRRSGGRQEWLQDGKK